MSYVTDCDYCGEIGLCVDHYGGTICSRCADDTATEECERCDGKGVVEYGYTCMTCGGEGEVEVST